MEKKFVKKTSLTRLDGEPVSVIGSSGDILGTGIIYNDGNKYRVDGVSFPAEAVLSVEPRARIIKVSMEIM
ncbi:MAG: hypothetical protein AABW80_05060 [Nanoarchaeota archaeon]